jgi:uncharacterized protein (TIGR03790 family)
MSMPRLLAGVLTALVTSLVPLADVQAQSVENVAVVINDQSDASRRIGEHYAKTRGLPASNVFHIKTTTADSIERADYVTTIERPLAAAIRRAGMQDRILYIVLTKGVPLRVLGTAGTTGTVASVDSELTLLYRRLVGTPIAADGRVDNPYYLGQRPIGEARPFTHREHDIYLVTRIDAYTVDQAIALIDRSQSPAQQGRIVLDQQASGTGDQWLAEAAKRLAAQGHAGRVLLENTAKPARGETPVLGYYSLSASDPENRVRSVEMGFAPGSIAANLASFDARTFRQPPDSWRPTAIADKAAWFEGSGDTLIGDFIRDGVTGVSGQVGEAYAFGATRPEILFPAYFGGFNLAEAFYLATPSLSWQTVVIGDPLCAPFGRMPLTRDALEEPIDPVSEYPGLFAKRRAPVVLAANPGVPAAASTALIRAQAMLDRDDREKARAALEEVVKLSPRAVGPLVRLAQVEEQMGEYDAAVARYRGVLELQPDNPAALNNIAYHLAVRQKAPQEALPFAEKAARAAPLNGPVLDTIGWIHHLLGNNELAAKFIAQAVRFDSSQPEIRLHAALVYMAVGNVERAALELKEALRLDPKLSAREDVQRLQLQLRK